MMCKIKQCKEEIEQKKGLETTRTNLKRIMYSKHYRSTSDWKNILLTSSICIIINKRAFKFL